jgi:hypothetical protein
MAEHRRYTKRQKMHAVTAALASSVSAAADSTGIPRTTIDYWLDAPEFGELRQKTRDDLAAEMSMLAHLAASKLAKAIIAGEVEARDLIVALGVSTDKAQLLSGAATSRTENRTLTDGLNDHEKQQLRDALDRLLADAPEAAAGVDAVGVGAEVRE